MYIYRTEIQLVSILQKFNYLFVLKNKIKYTYVKRIYFKLISGYLEKNLF